MNWKYIVSLLFLLNIGQNSAANNDEEIRWQQAIQEAKTGNPAILPYPPLSIIAPWNNTLTWSDENKNQVMMIQFLRKNGRSFNDLYKPNVEKNITLATQVWVSPNPELKKFIAQFKHENPQATREELTYRVKQFLGMKSSDNEFVIIELWVKPSDLFRPCLNSEIFYPGCIPDLKKEELPESYQQLYHYHDNQNDSTHMKWFIDTKSKQYSGQNAVPWTRLGYTYDWGSDSKIGASEYIIKSGAQVTINKIYEIDQYT